jgi:hypothetical protein
MERNSQKKKSIAQASTAEKQVSFSQSGKPNIPEGILIEL